MASKQKKCGNCQGTFPVIYVDEKTEQNYFFHSDACRAAFLEGKEPAKKAPRGYRKCGPLCHQCKTPMSLSQFNYSFCSLHCLTVIREEQMEIQREYEEEQRKNASRGSGSYHSGAGQCH